MARRVSELVDVRVVQETGDAPMAFLWRGRLYVVREVLGHWRERRDWWSTAAARALHGDERSADRPATSPEGPSFAVWSGESGGSSGELPGGVPGGTRGTVAERRQGPSDHPHRPHERHYGGGQRRSHGRQGAGEPVGEVRQSAGGHDDTGKAERSQEFLRDTECEVWRVEASTGRAFGNGVYDLSRTPSSTSAADSWRLLQVAD
ncbi:DUF6504 family protein [Kineosporia rhizophila]|uniref:DUF6504 family protein n=1 Tax=Kineosporia rhizophila TaxID=84633 RepID=UPI001E328EAF|nr:DUF6504 family protein [Kineosporia rhizophila]MCE0538351.1 DUF6504 family protein [Kineosporia rhizophila]